MTASKADCSDAPNEMPPLSGRVSLLGRPAVFAHAPQRLFHTSIPRLNEEEKPAPEIPAAPEEPPKEYSTPELTADAAAHKAALNDPDRPEWQNPLIHKNPASEKVLQEDFDSEQEFQENVVPAPPLDKGDGSPPAPEYLNELADEIVNLTVLEMNELVNKMADHYGFHEGMLSPEDVGFGGGEADAGAEEEVKEEKTNFDVKLTGFDAKAKIKIIKEVRSIAGLGLKEAKEWVEGVPKVIQKDLKQEQADEIKAKLEELGATVEIV